MSLGLESISDCAACPAGYFCKDHTVLPQRCPVGTYMPTESAYMADVSTAAPGSESAACLPCEAGYACPSEGMSARDTCPAGTYSPAHSTQCFECRAGHLCPAAATTQAAYESQLCTAGGLCTGSTTSAATCPEGYYCPEGTWLKLQCPVGTFVNGAGLSSRDQCVDAGVGYYTDSQASLASQVAPNECEFGHRCPAGAHSAYQEACPPGTYQDARAQGACEVCPAGAVCDGTTFRHY